jgi:AraC-like DNA-binding protein
MGCSIVFGSERDEVTFAPSVAELALVDADPYLNQLLVGYCEDALAHHGRQPLSLRARVETAISQLLPHGKARIDDVARRLRMSRRTLSRRLAAEGASFGTILEELRVDLARAYLRDPTLSISQIAWLLGFREVSAFTHAHKRWTGRTPSAMRAEPTWIPARRPA